MRRKVVKKKEANCTVDLCSPSVKITFHRAERNTQDQGGVEGERE
jgi:hypothetical protein